MGAMELLLLRLLLLRLKPTWPFLQASDDEIKLGAFYDTRLVEDCKDPYFRLVNAQLQQLDISDAENKLIPPWKNYDPLRPGSLILALVSIHMYTFKSNGNDRDRDRKYFQLNAHTIRVLDESDFTVQKRLPPVPRNADAPSAGPSTPSTPGNGSGVTFNKNSSFVFTPRSSPTQKPASGNGPDEDDAMDGSGPSSSPSKKRKQSGRRS
ncbi:hypothetical protein B0H14DRAFT_2565020 [Mycena olivaceomarginata]|nr:hypothetical protein B0H14DRAFT_2565020 [Mycena olivaceomarginata]